MLRNLLVIAVLLSCFFSSPTPAVAQSLASAQNQRGRGALNSPALRAGRALTVTGSGSYTYAVPLFTLPGRRGLNVNLSLVYNSLVWEAAAGGVTFDPDDDFSEFMPGFRVDFGSLIWIQPNGTVTSGVLVESNGTKHDLIPVAGSSTQFTTSDSTYITVQHHYSTGSSDPESDVVIYKNGARAFYKFGLTNSLGDMSITQPTKIEDTTGNFISISYTGGWQFAAPSISTITDTVGRKISFFYTVTDSAGDLRLNCVTDGASCGAAGSRTFTFNWNPNYILHYNFTSVVSDGSWGVAPLQGSQYPYTVLSGVTRPDGTAVKFNYGDWLIVDDIQEMSSNGTLRYEASYNFPSASSGTLSQPPTYTTQTVTTYDKDGNSQQAVWTNQAASSCFAQTDPAGTIHLTNFSTQTGLPTQQLIATGSSSPCTTAPTTIWQTVNTTWTSDTNGANPRPQAKTIILSDGSTQSQVQFASYDAHGDVTDLKEYDFGAGAPGPLLKETGTAYATNLGSIFGLPNDLQIRDGNGNYLSHQTFTYDNYATTGLQSYSTLPTNFDSNFSSSTAPPRGNLTGSTVYANGALGTGAINSTFTYDVLGNMLTSVSGTSTGAQTAAVYSLNTEYAYPDSVSIGPSKSQLTTSFTYNLSNGKVASSTDPNGQKTQFSYDIDSRLSSTTTPDSITSTYSYDDSVSNPTATVSTTANSLVSKSVSDFLGRALIR